MLSIAVVEGLREDCERMKAEIDAYASTSRAEMDCRAFSDAASFLQAHAQAPFQLAFLDIGTEDPDGIELFRILRRTDTRLLIVFVSASREYAFDVFPAHPFDYLVKPCAPERLRGVLDEAVRALCAAEATIEIRIPHATLSVRTDRISAITADNHTVDIVLTDRQRLRSIMTFREIYDRLRGEERFLLLNRGVLVNMDDVLMVQGESVHMKTGDVYPMRTRGRGALISRFTQYQVARMKKERPT